MKSALSSIFRFLLLLAGLAIAGGLGVPVAGYLIGKQVIGAYEGKLGLTDYANSIYTGAGQGDILAWLILLSPGLIVLAWWLVVRLDRRLVHRAG